MNYIRHMNGFFGRLTEDKRMSSYHISLYFALFQQWNADRFGEQFVISRTEIMELSRLGSVNTYARCMKELSEWGYINYIPSSNLHIGSRVSCIRFDTASDTTSNTGTDTVKNTGIENDIARNIGIKNDTSGDTGTDTASDTGISSSLKSDTGRNTAGEKIGGAGIKNDTARNTGTDTPFINSLNKNKQEEESVRRNLKLDVDENEKKQKRFRTTNSENLPDQKSPVPYLSEVEQFFEQNQ
ncbi:MAG TPA: hypothetical protein DHV48_15710, partial [Prolixibacteraceae bacterium]|nr:hypothetical protein [Prolixibacteraceae bacterium]